MPREVTTWLKIRDARAHLEAIGKAIDAALGSEGYPIPINTAESRRVDQLRELLEWFAAAAEERDRLKAQRICGGCKVTIPQGTGLEKGGVLRPLCPTCQIRAIGEMMS